MAELRDSAPGKDSISLPRACSSPGQPFRRRWRHPAAARCFAVLPSERLKATAQFQAVIVPVCQAASAHSCIAGGSGVKHLDRPESLSIMLLRLGGATRDPRVVCGLLHLGAVGGLSSLAR